MGDMIAGTVPCVLTTASWLLASWPAKLLRRTSGMVG